MAENRDDYFSVLTDAVKAMSESGFVSAEQVLYWQRKLREAAERSFRSAAQMEQDLRDALAGTYKRMVEQGGALKFHKGVGRFTLDRLRPSLKAALDRRIMASADLIKLNRQQAIEKTLQRFSGWATSIPAGGATDIDKVETKQQIRKSLAQLPYEERRLHIDQASKLTANINETIAEGGNALGVIWHSAWRQAGYNYRPDHKARDQHFFAYKDNWAIKRGLMKKGPNDYYDDITHVGEEIFCRCKATYVYNLRDVPDECMTEKGRAELAEARRKLEEL